jgi:hypothetical protein
MFVLIAAFIRTLNGSVSEIDFSQSNEEAHEIADLLSEFLNQIVDSFLARPGKATELIQRVLARKKKR